MKNNFDQLFIKHYEELKPLQQIDEDAFQDTYIQCARFWSGQNEESLIPYFRRTFFCLCHKVMEKEAKRKEIERDYANNQADIYEEDS